MNAVELLAALPVRPAARTRGAVMTDPCALGGPPCIDEGDRARVREVAQVYVDRISQAPFEWTCAHGHLQVRVEPSPTPPGADILRGGVVL